MITDGRRVGPKIFALMPYRVQPNDNRSEGTQAKGTYADAIQSTAHVITDAMRPRPKVSMLTPYRVQPYDNRRKETQAKGTYADVMQGTDAR